LIFNPGVQFRRGDQVYIGRGVSGQAPQNFFKIAHQFLIPLHPSTAYIDWDDVERAF
jgi:hypothetical protein